VAIALLFCASTADAFSSAGSPLLPGARVPLAVSSRQRAPVQALQMASTGKEWVRPQPRGKMDVMIGGRVETSQNVLPVKADEGCTLAAYMRSSPDQSNALTAPTATLPPLTLAWPLAVYLRISTCSSRCRTRPALNARTISTSPSGFAPNPPPWS